MKIDGKFTIWQRFEIPDEASKDFLAFINKNPRASFEEIYDWAHEQGFDPESETLEGTGEPLDREENNNQPTIEAWCNKDCVIWEN
jgi:hypothetical protein